MRTAFWWSNPVVNANAAIVVVAKYEVKLVLQEFYAESWTNSMIELTQLDRKKTKEGNLSPIAVLVASPLHSPLLGFVDPTA
jgi:hypothetical protein